MRAAGGAGSGLPGAGRLLGRCLLGLG
ncbi:hypothetical protein GA0115236_11601, partial [Streptomyces sp. IgraMP-1]